MNHCDEKHCFNPSNIPEPLALPRHGREGISYPFLCKNYFPESVVEKMKAHPIRHGTEILYGGEGTTAELLARRVLRRIHAAPRSAT